MKQKMKKKKSGSQVVLLLALMLSCFFTLNSEAQDQVSGTVTGVDGTPIPGVNVLQKGTSKGAVTDFDGRYSLQLTIGDKALVFSYIGFQTIEVPVGKKNEVNVTLEEDVAGLEEVVVIGYAPIEKKKVLGAVAGVKAEDIAQATPVQAFDAVQGKLSGVQIVSNNGPGQGFDIRVRGVSTFGSGSSPLYVVDGQQLDNIDNIDPSDIASLEVLKDGATAAIYGSKAANGVVIITTKSGKAGDLRLDVSHVTGLNTLVGDLPVLNSEQRFLLERKRSNNLTTLTKLERDSLSLLRRNDYDLQKLLTRTAVRSQTNVALSGGNDKFKFYWNTGFLKEDGVIINSGYKRINTQLKLDVTPNKALKLGTRVTVTGETKTGLTEGGVFTHTIARLPYLPLYNPDGTFTPTLAGRKNPLAFANEQVRDDRNYRIQTFNYAQLQLLPNLTIKSTLGINWRFRKQNQFDTRLIQNRFETGTAKGNLIQTMSYDIQQENFLNYKNRWGKHNFGAFGGMQIQKYVSENTDFRTSEYNNEYVQTFNNAAPGTITGDRNEDSRHNLYSLFAGFNYDFSNKYLVGATIRRDGSSRFGDSNEFGYFPSATLGWRISKESFLKESKLINNLLVRASWGIVGNERIGNYLFTDALEPGFTYNSSPGVAATRIGNSDLSWEETESFNLGLDIELLKKRLEVSVDLWTKNTTDLLALSPLPAESGFGGITRNVGAVNNKGIDFSITGTIIKSKDFTWSSNFNIGYLENEVTKLDGGTDYLVPGNRYIAREGEPVGSVYGYKNLGVYAYDESNAYTAQGEQLTPNFDAGGTFVNYTLNGTEYTDEVQKMKAGSKTLVGGDIIWKDNNGDFVIDVNDREIIGNGLPTVTGGFSHNFKYKNFSLSLLLDYSLNHDIYRRWDEERNDFNTGAESPGIDRVLGAWMNPGDVTLYPRLDIRQSQNQLNPNSFFVTDGSYIKLRYVRCNYNFPKAITDKVKGLKNLSLNVAVNNVLTWTNYEGYNPELGTRGNVLQSGLDGLRYPNDREIILGLKAQF